MHFGAFSCHFKIESDCTNLSPHAEKISALATIVIRHQTRELYWYGKLVDLSYSESHDFEQKKVLKNSAVEFHETLKKKHR